MALDETAQAAQARIWRLTLILVGVLTVLRVVALFVTPLELYPDEAQYWLWSRHLDFGYFSKPPVIAWLIWATTRIGGDAEAWLRIGSPLINAGTALVVSRIATRLYGAERGGAWVGLAAAAIFSLMPGIQLSSVLITTDTPLLFFLALMIWACVALPHASPRARIWVAAGMGAALGLAFLSKYAAIYALASLGAHLVLSREARRAWTPAMAAAFFVTLFAVFAPNMIWNYQHHFSTLEHTAANANWKAGKLFNPLELVQFVGSQFGVFGPVPFGVLGGGALLLAIRRRLAPADVMLLCFALPPLATVAAQAFVSRANANWAGAAYVAGSVLVAAWLLRWEARRWLVGGLALQAVLAVVFLAWVIAPRTADAMGMANAFKRARGWDQTVQAIIERSREEQALHGGLTAVAVDDRFLYNVAAYYGRGYFGTPEAPPLRMWVHEIAPRNQAEVEAPLDAALGRRTLIASLDGVYRGKIQQDFKATSDLQIVSVRLDRKRSRRTDLFIAQDFAPVPRDPMTGLPPDTPWRDPGK
ncbi:glycosyltransferase family 39 protein [Caulobacter sp. UNC279MFTsu5.1]|uniref:ArnT family glycosyltransferase n=1 Tax=Caulobacter sp. UNC279MFTsu5.1 TaxID=1502775 RepID=UPI0008E3863B|nr:glycosyltransferase family 39 protein [Caulobacter sp. UNC279MFTsu5.1]SFJ73286.1 4-amino-4-deoxy-L-arabinose transferase [Caulobacter sp. UNC279MFTsu5.1]